MTDAEEKQPGEESIDLSIEETIPLPDAVPADELSLEDQLAASQAELRDHYDQMLRARAELDNYRKRAQKEQQEMRQYQSMSIIRDLLPTLDNLGRAVDAAAEAKSVDSLVEGVNMVRQQLDETLGRYSVTPIASVGQPFDPNLHEAVQQIPSADHPAMTVLQEVERGYTLHDRVVRPSKVIVSSGPPEEG